VKAPKIGKNTDKAKEHQKSERAIELRKNKRYRNVIDRKA
jgi:hypothetical protein